MSSFTSSIEIGKPQKVVLRELVNYSQWATWFSVMGRKINRSNLLVDNQGKGDVIRCFLTDSEYADIEVLQGDHKVALRLLRVQSELKENIAGYSTFVLSGNGSTTILENGVDIQLKGMLTMMQPLLSLKGKQIQKQLLERFKLYVESR